MDMKDLKDKKPPVGQAELRRRVRMALQTQKSKDACERMMRSLVETMHVVIKKKTSRRAAELTASKDEARDRSIPLTVFESFVKMQA